MHLKISMSTFFDKDLIDIKEKNMTPFSLGGKLSGQIAGYVRGRVGN